MRVLVTGASGFVGPLLIARLRADGHDVRAFARDEARARQALMRVDAAAGGEVEVIRGDALTGAGLTRALEGTQVAYYLIHSMEQTRRTGSAGPHAFSAFPERETLAAEQFAAAARAAGVQRIVYLGGLMPRADPPSAHSTGDVDEHTRLQISRHLESRERVERILLDALPDSLALRASIVIGARSRSFRLLVHLVERMPVLTLPAWHSLRTQPIDERDVIEMLNACLHAQPPRRSLDIGGAQTLTYGQMLQTIADVMLVNRPTVRFALNLTGITARVAAAVAQEDPELVLALMEGLQGDLLAADHHTAELLGVRLHSFESAVEHALAQWLLEEPLAAR